MTYDISLIYGYNVGMEISSSDTSCDAFACTISSGCVSKPCLEVFLSALTQMYLACPWPEWLVLLSLLFFLLCMQWWCSPCGGWRLREQRRPWS